MKSTDKPVRLFRYGRAAAGLILLVNPIISLYDILPDFIGYLLLFTALREVSRLEGRMEDAQSRLIWLAAFSGLRLTLALVFYDAQSSFKLLVCFSLAVVELVTFLMWSASFFSGLEYLAQPQRRGRTRRQAFERAFPDGAVLHRSAPPATCCPSSPRCSRTRR